MGLSLKINQDEHFSFFEKYDLLTSLQKKIWSMTVWWVKRFPVAAPSQAKIALKCGCRREHVNRTFALFKEWGWLALNSRGARRTKVLSIPTHLLMMDVSKREYFKRVEITSERTHSYSKNRDITGRRTGEILTPHKFLENYNLRGMSPENLYKLSLVPEFIIHEARRKAIEIGKHGWRPKDPQSYVVGIALNMAKNAGLRIDWRSYYKTMERIGV